MNQTKLIIYVLMLQGVGRRYANIVCKKADIDLTKRAGELTEEEVSRFYRLNKSYFKIHNIIQNFQNN